MTQTAAIPQKTVRIIPATIDAKAAIAQNYRQLRVAAYCRVSTKQDEQLNSYEVQKTHYEERIRTEPKWTLVGIFADKGITGTSMKKRDEFNKMLRLCYKGKIDMIIAGMSPTDERKESIDFSDNYYVSDLVMVVRKDGAYANATSLADFSGAKITAQLNTFHYTVIDQIPGVDKQTAMEDFPTMIVALQSGKIDGYISERPGAMSAQMSNPDLTYIAFAEGKGFDYSTDEGAIAVGIKKGSDLKDQINKVLAGISEDDRQSMMENAIANQPAAE